MKAKRNIFSEVFMQGCFKIIFLPYHFSASEFTHTPGQAKVLAEK
jgi:hypothetical protein